MHAAACRHPLHDAGWHCQCCAACSEPPRVARVAPTCCPPCLLGDGGRVAQDRACSCRFERLVSHLYRTPLDLPLVWTTILESGLDLTANPAFVVPVGRPVRSSAHSVGGETIARDDTSIDLEDPQLESLCRTLPASRRHIPHRSEAHSPKSKSRSTLTACLLAWRDHHRFHVLPVDGRIRAVANIPGKHSRLTLWPADSEHGAYVSSPLRAARSFWSEACTIGRMVRSNRTAARRKSRYARRGYDYGAASGGPRTPLRC